MTSNLSDQITIGNSSIHNNGLFAAKDFKVGDRILCESPLLVCPYRGVNPTFDVIQLSKTIESVSSTVLSSIRSLHCPINDAFYLKKAKFLIQPYSSSLHPDSISSLTELVIIFLVNGLRIRVQNEEEGDERIIGSGLFHVTSHCNHSCLPNAEWTTTLTKNNRIKITLKAVQSIPKGQEILIAYFGHNHSFRDTAFRISYLKTGWNFKCQCTRCTAEFDDVRRYKVQSTKSNDSTNSNSNSHSNSGSIRSNTFSSFECTKNKDYSLNRYKVEKEFIASKLWNDINDHDLSSWGSTPRQQLKVIENAIQKLKTAGVHDTHYLLIELSFPRIALVAILRGDGKEGMNEVLTLMEDRNRRMKSLCNQPNVRLLENMMECIETMEAVESECVSSEYYGFNALKSRMTHIQDALKMAYVLYPRDEHASITKLKRMLLSVEKQITKIKVDGIEYTVGVCVICRVYGVRMRCGKCRKAFYCGSQHQRDHWKVHKLCCKKC